MKSKILAVVITIGLFSMLTVGYVNAASVSATINATYLGSPTTNAPQGATIDLHCSFTVDPAELGTGTIQYKYSADGVTYSDKITITTISNWDGSETVVPFTLSDAGYYRFYLTAESVSEASATTLYPSSGAFHSELPSPVPEAPSSIIALVVAFVAVGLFVVVKKRHA